jgi:hypothetical protein
LKIANLTGRIRAVEDPALPNSQDEKQIQALGQRILLACVTKMGGVVPVARYLQVSEEQLREWIAGKTVPPAAIVLKSLDPVVGEPEAIWGDRPQPDPDSPQLQ